MMIIASRHIPQNAGTRYINAPSSVYHLGVEAAYQRPKAQHIPEG
jgi:hypothetical protein